MGWRMRSGCEGSGFAVPYIGNVCITGTGLRGYSVPVMNLLADAAVSEWDGSKEPSLRKKNVSS